MSSPSAPPPTERWRTLQRQAWEAQLRQPLQAAEIGRLLVAQHLQGSAAAAHGLFHVAWAELRWGSAPAAQQAAAQLAQHASRLPDDAEVQAAHRDLQASFLRRQLRHTEALALLQVNLAMAENERPPHAHWCSLNGAAISCGALHQMDDALRHFHRAMAWAEASGDAALIANAAGNLGAAHLDVYNLDDALHWTRESHEQAQRSGAHGARATAAVNLILILCEKRQHAQALPLVQELRAQSQGVRADKRGKYATIFAEVARGLGRREEAQTLLDEAAALRAPGEAPSQEWVSVQADLLLASGQAAQARAMLEAQLAAPASANLHDLPLNRLRLHDLAAQASEALADWSAALAHQRQSMARREQLIGRSVRAFRLSREVEHELDRARRQRDAARAEQQRLAELNAALAAANRAKTDFLAAASHDLRQPVHALALQVAALRGEPLTARQQQMADRIERCVGALSSLFDGLLDLSRLDAGVVQPQWQTVALPGLLAALVEETEAEAARKGLHLSLRLPRSTGLPCTHSDPMLLQRLLRNLLVNAVKYTERGSVMLALRARAGGWCIEVRDSGVGIAAELQPRVFDEFVQGHNPARQRDQGLGLGLAIVARLARVLDHTVSLRSAPGCGTTVALQLGAVSPTAPDVCLEHIRKPAMGLRVVVIDDDPETRAALHDLLALWGCQAQVADRTEALACDAGWCPDAAIVDYRLPQGRDGLSEIRRLRERWGQRLPCLLVTGETSPGLLMQLQDSAQAWAAKPLAAQSLRQWLATHQPIRPAV